MLSSWVYFFAEYMAVLTLNLRTHEMLAYCRLVNHEALRHGDDGWLEYDCTFRHQAAVDPSLPWHSLVPGLQAATILSTHPSGGNFAQFAASLITQQVSVPFQLPSLQHILIVADCHSRLM